MNNIITVADHILLPHQADWNSRPAIRRMWRSSVDNALTGAEDRLSVRSVPWMKLEYEVLPFDGVERGRFDSRMRAALKAGKMTVPLFGRGVPIATAARSGDTELILNRSNHTFEANKYVIVQPSTPALFDTFDVCLIDSVVGARLNISDPLDNAYARGTNVWPLLFGKPIPDYFQILNSSRARYSVALQFDGRTISGLATDDFETYELGPIGTLDGGEGWAGAWQWSAYAA